MTNEPIVPDWATPGSVVAVGSGTGYPYYGNVGLYTVTRTTRTQIIIEHGSTERRFRIQDLRETGKRHTRLYQLNEPFVIRARRRKAMDDLNRTIVKLIEDKTEGHEHDTLTAVREAIDTTEQRLSAITAHAQN